MLALNSFLSSGDNFANCMDPNQVQQNVGHDLGAMLFDTPIVFLKDSFENVCLIKSADEKENVQHAKS